MVVVGDEAPVSAMDGVDSILRPRLTRNRSVTLARDVTQSNDRTRRVEQLARFQVGLGEEIVYGLYLG